MALGVGDGSALSAVGSGMALGVGDGSALSAVGSGMALGVGDGSALSAVGSGMALGVDDGSALSAVGSGEAVGVGDGSALSAVGSGEAVGVGDGSALSAVGSGVAVAVGVGDGSALSAVGSGVAVGVGNGSAFSAVGPGVICPEDALPSGSPVARSESGRSVGAVGRSEDGSSEPPQATSINGRSSAMAKTPRKRRGVLISLQSLHLLGRGEYRVRMLTHVGGLPASAPGAVESMTPPVYSSDVRFNSAGAAGWLCSVGAPMAKTPAPGERAWATVHQTGGNSASKARCLPSVVCSCQTGPICPPGLRRLNGTPVVRTAILSSVPPAAARTSAPVGGRVKPLSKARGDRELYRILPKQQRPSTRSTGPLPLASHR